MIEELKKGERFLVKEYKDGSKKVYRTTLNFKILGLLNIKDFENLYDLDTLEKIDIESNSSYGLRLFKEYPKLGGLDAYVNKFTR